MKMEFEYGKGTVEAKLPDNTDIFIPGETVKDPEYIPEEQLEKAYLESLAHPIGMPRLSELADKESKVTFVVPDRVKGGEQETSHRKLSIKYILRAELKNIIFYLLSPTDCILRVRRRMQKQYWEKKFLISSGIPDKYSAMTAKIRNIWFIWA